MTIGDNSYTFFVTIGDKCTSINHYISTTLFLFGDNWGQVYFQIKHFFQENKKLEKEREKLIQVLQDVLL